MAQKTIKVRMKVSWGHPTNGGIIRAGAVVELPEFWANKFIADGTAEEVKTEEVKADSGDTKKGKK